MTDQPYTSDHEARHLARVAEDRAERAHDAQQEDADRAYMARLARHAAGCECPAHLLMRPQRRAQ